jgi:hypothetical protein
LSSTVTTRTPGPVLVRRAGPADLFEADDEVIVAPTRTPAGLCFGTVPEDKTIGSRLHIGLDPDDQAAEVAGARCPARRRGEDVPWVVLADPEATSSRAQPHGSLID